MRFLDKLMLVVPVMVMAVKTRFLDKLNIPRTVLFVMVMVIIVNGFLLAVNGFLLYRLLAPTPSGFSADAATGDVRTPASVEESAVPQANEADYVAEVGDIQNGSVEIFASTNERLLHYDTLTASDIEGLESNYLLLANYRAQAESLDTPEQYEHHHQAFSEGIGELYKAGKIAYRLAADPVSATQADFRSYDEHVDLATTLLRQSNQTLGEDYETTEGLKLPAKAL